MRDFVKGMVMTLAALVVLTSCDPSRKWEKEEQLRIDEFLSQRGDTVIQAYPSTLRVWTVTEGTGLTPDDKDTVTIRYKGMFLDFITFDSNYTSASPLKFIAGSGYIIPGLDEAVRYMKEGGTYRVLTPSPLAYGTTGMAWIPGYTPLQWTILLVDVGKAE